MNTVDIILIALIAGGALWLLYRTLWKTKGGCHSSDCSGCSCDSKTKDEH